MCVYMYIYMYVFYATLNRAFFKLDIDLKLIRSSESVHWVYFVDSADPRSQNFQNFL